MSHLNNRSQTSARRSDYVWQYEYYDDDEPVSYEGLRAHRYSIVIGFWVGLAVFVIFMFFVLTLLTKTGAPHQENPESAEKRHQHRSCLVDINGPSEENDKAFSRPLLPETRSHFNFYVSEGSQRKQARQNGSVSVNGPGVTGAAVVDVGGAEDGERGGGLLAIKGLMEDSTLEKECDFLSHFTIPNFVERSSSLGEDDIVFDASVKPRRQSQTQDLHCEDQ
ncbi:melanocortin-2 receptor accessory protein 2A-like [Synchiropus splendidus]|uniref:melanocortin-2 receptor accessory protein 2A-like n=1 Tax=Synchiropus splendidus TaxID=270530 RepID=UPI00237D7898|nr:melanocortin-2 receptor accessory protein 2A-like [Synchiropus splendidus]